MNGINVIDSDDDIAVGSGLASGASELSMMDSTDDADSVIEAPWPDLYIMVNKKDIGLAYKKDAKNIYLALGMFALTDLITVIALVYVISYKLCHLI